MASQDGPKTRHMKDRRPSHITETASMTAATERTEARPRAPEARHQTVPRPQTHNEPSAEFRSEKASPTVPMRFNLQDERVTSLQAEHKTLQATLAKLEERIKPYEEYQQQALDVVKQLQDVQGRLQRHRSESASPARTIAALTTSINAHEASTSEHSNQLLQLGDRIALLEAQPLSTQDLALVLVSRLQRGDVLKSSTSAALRLALGSGDAASPAREAVAPRQQVTPVTDDPESRQPPIERSIEAQSTLPSPPKKRRRIGTPSKALSSVQRVRFESADLETPEVDDALDSFMSGALPNNQTENEAVGSQVTTSVAKEAVVSNTPETRRASQRARTSTTQPGFTHWRDANKIVKGVRSSGPSPRKGVV
ncbi:hypothetical protein LTR35_016187 [Friedmanniomyces endolithicus]|uniref:Uncharacterized protein n=1 Tax=Friedmanniomyces endolithicus TaxID=329885 RepID=A0AAN6F8E0_9PEZI|nr:hypothetical protein LTR35_016187 [Friedmanniomyces endolithicus]KAK0297807.1 hypothetical protein LTS00_003345 [Friedmanniomyces endolithicus]KAK0306211.1 hypothetical protein LTR82_016509 [Friedmanniomyces endolithicus]KAK0975703.1 hypothetical protein LTR54_016726 [Friedmanniomyces endolithicus]